MNNYKSDHQLTNLNFSFEKLIINEKPVSPSMNPIDIINLIQKKLHIRKPIYEFFYSYNYEGGLFNSELKFRNKLYQSKIAHRTRWGAKEDVATIALLDIISNLTREEKDKLKKKVIKFNYGNIKEFVPKSMQWWYNQPET